MDIAWEWLRRDANYQSDYQSLENAQRLSDTTETFRQQWGLLFAADPQKPFDNNRFSGPLSSIDCPVAPGGILAR